jgi:hypothetical protein
MSCLAHISPIVHNSLENGSMTSTFICGFKTYKHVTSVVNFVMILKTIHHKLATQFEKGVDMYIKLNVLRWIYINARIHVLLATM